MNGNISNEFHISDVYRSLNYIGSLANLDKHWKMKFIPYIRFTFKLHKYEQRRCKYEMNFIFFLTFIEG